MHRSIRWLSLALAPLGVLAVPARAFAFPPELESYDDRHLSVIEQLQHRIEVEPFNLAATIIFLLAILHTFLASRFLRQAHHLEEQHAKRIERGEAPLRSVSAMGRLFHYLGEVEVVFGLWGLALFIALVVAHGGDVAVHYVSHEVDFTEAMFVVAIMTLASTRPILQLAESMMGVVARAFGGTLAAWWLTVLTVGPVLGSFITEPAAMTLSALLLSRKLYALNPSTRLAYATLGLLFVNVSIGGTLTSFAAPPVLMVAEPWGWDTAHMAAAFGWKAALSILVGNLVAFALFRRELAEMQTRFAKRELKARISASYLPEEASERAMADVSAEVLDELDVRRRLEEAVDESEAELRARLEKRFLDFVKREDPDIDLELAREAFDERFDELELRRLQRAIPVLLPEDKRPPFLDPRWDERRKRAPFWVTVVHLGFMAVTIANVHHPAIFVGALLFFLGFANVTADYQNRLDIKAPMLVGFFLAGLVIHGGVQGWWIAPVLGSLGDVPLMLTSAGLTAFNDNAAITYLSTLVPDFDAALKYAVVAGAVGGGGLTVIANAPNPAGQAVLKRHFDGGIRPLRLFLAAVGPTALALIIFLATR